MIEKSKVEAIIKENLDADNEFLVNLSISSGNTIMVLLDSDKGITIDRCVAISRAIEQSFDRETEDFELEVASAGLSESLKLPRQYKKNMGRSLEVLMTDGVKVKGSLVQANELDFTLEFEKIEKVEGKKRKQKTFEQITINYTDVKTAFVVVSFR
jgi:ribosome maturation factor RimP